VIASTADGVVLDVRVIPRSSNAGVVGVRQDALLIRLTAPPAEGQANQQLLEVLAATLEVPKRSITIVAGSRSRNKRVRITGVTVQEVTANLGIR
jgi:hypothetical protein